MSVKRSDFLLILIYYVHVRQYKHVLDEQDHGNQQNPPFSKLQIEQLEQFEGSRTFTNFIEPILPKNRTEQPWLQDVSSWHP
jgi:hypothetical protein